jgi:xanthine/uracil/vitamin C permease (AzgA family)
VQAQKLTYQVAFSAVFIAAILFPALADSAPYEAYRGDSY